MIKLLFSICLLMIHSVSMGQKLSGVVRDSASGEALPFTTVSVKSPAGKILTGTLTNEEGYFTLNVPAEAASIEFDHIAYVQKVVNQPFSRDKLALIQLDVDKTQLDEVIVKGERTSREFLIDRKVINFGSDLQMAGGSVLEAFEQLPDIETNPITGDVRLRGNENVRILVNGKPSPLNNRDLLEQLNVSQVEKVEVITSPSARYQADGLAGIINIVLKDKLIDGIAASASVDARTNPAYGGSFNFISGFNSFNLQTTVSHRQHYFENEEFASRHLVAITEQQQVASFRSFDGQLNVLNFKADWFLNEFNDLSLAVNLTNNEHEIFSSTRIASDLNLINNELTNFHRHNTAEYNINYRKRFDEDGIRYLDVDINFNDNNNTLPSTIFNNGEFLIDNEIFYNNEILNGAMDFVTPLGQFNVETGLLYTYKQINNEQFTLTDTGNTKSFYNYNENTFAGYIVVNRKINKWGIQVGLRSEQFESDGRTSETEQLINLNFFSLFPSIHIQYKKNDLLNYTLGYNRRIARPSFYHINPITTINDPLFRRVGNPALQPEFTDNLEVGLNFNAKKINVNTSLYYRHMTNLINQTFEIDDNKVTIMSFNNGGESHTVGTEINVLKDINEHFSASWSGNAYYQHASPMLDDFFYEDQYNYNFRTKLNYKTGKKFSLDVQWMYFGPSRRLNVDVEDRNFINLAVRYKILKGAGTINLRFTDIFRGNIFENERISHELLEENKWLGQTRLAILSFTYNFNKGNIKRRKGSQKSYNESGALE